MEELYETIMQVLRKNSRILDALRKAIDYEETHSQEQHYLGWEWWEVSLRPVQLNKLIEEGVVNINYKSNNSTHYLLVDREQTKKAIGDYVLAVEETAVDEGMEEKIPDNLFDTIVGYEDIKELMLRSIKSEEPIHILLCGPPATGKTVFVEEIQRLKGCRTCSGTSTKRAGITRFLIDFRPKILIVDEIDKMDASDTDSLLTLMSSGVINEMKTGRTQELKLGTKVYATCNKLEELTEQLISRFTVFTLQEYSRDELKEVMYKTLSMLEKCDSDTAEFISEELIKAGSKDVRDAVRVWRFVKLMDPRKHKDEVIRVINVLRRYGG